MVIDKIENLAKYVALNPLFQQVVDFIAQTDLAKHEAGKVELAGKDLFANFTVAKGKTKEVARLETHNVMLDIQIPISCPETMGYTPRADLPEQPYNAEKDITKIPDLAADSYLTCQPGMMAIFFPQDGHAPCIAGVPEIKKAIFKVKA